MVGVNAWQGGPNLDGDCPAEDGFWLCTLNRGHEGAHEAWGTADVTTPYHIWPVPEAEVAAREFAALDAMIRETHPRPGDTRTCPGCGRPQHYSGAELGWCHDALVDTWHCADPKHVSLLGRDGA